MNKQGIVGALVLSIALPGWMGSVSQAADLMDVYQVALENDARLQAASFEFKASSEAIAQARSALLPDLAFEAEYIESKQKIISSDNTVFASGSTDFPTDTYNLTLNVPVFRYDAWKRFSQSKAVVKQAKAELLAAEQKLMFDSAQAYFNVLAAKDNLEFSRAERLAVGRQLELAQERVNRGLATITDLRDAQARSATSESQAIEAENAMEDAYRALQELTAELVEDLNTLREDIPLTDPGAAELQDWISTAQNQNYGLEAFRHAIKVAEEEKKRQRAGHMPTLDLVGTLNNRDTDGSLFGGGSEVRTNDYLLRLRVPIFQGGGTSSMTREAGYRHQKAKREYEVERRALERETRAAYQGILSGKKKVEALKKSVVFQKSALEVKEEGFKAGINTVLAVLDAQRDLYFAQRDYSQARYDYLLNVLRLKKAAGSLSPDDLKSLNKLLAKS